MNRFAHIAEILSALNHAGLMDRGPEAQVVHRVRPRRPAPPPPDVCMPCLGTGYLLDLGRGSTSVCHCCDGHAVEGAPRHYMGPIQGVKRWWERAR